MRWILGIIVTSVVAVLIAKYVVPAHVEKFQQGMYPPRRDDAPIAQEARRQAQEAFEALESGNYMRAESLYVALITLFPSEPLFHFNLGAVYAETKQFDEASRSFEKVVRLDSIDYRAWNNLGRSLLSADKWEAGVKALKKCIDIMPRELYAYVNLGDAYFEADSLERSAEYFRHAINLDNRHPIAFLGLGRTLIAAGEIEQAIDTLGKILKMEVSKDFIAEAHFYLGNAYSQSGQLDQAVTEFQACLSLDSSHSVEAWGILGAIEGNRGNCEKAAEYFQRAVDLDTMNAEALFSLGAAHIECGSLQIGLPIWQRMLQIEMSDSVKFDYNMRQNKIINRSIDVYTDDSGQGIWLRTRKR